MTDVFLSYSRKDTDSVKELFESLGARNREVWIDLHGIEYSSKWWDEICAGIDGADNFVLMVSQNALESLFCHREIQYALKHNKRIIPFLLKPVDEKAMFKAWENDPELCKYEQQTKENWESIQSIQWIDFTQIKDVEKGVDALLVTVDTDPERVKLHTRLLLRMRDWEGTGRNPSGLLRGDELALYEKWFADSREKGTPPHPTDEQEAYIVESRRVQDELEAKRIQRERLVKGFRVASVVMGLFLIFTVAAIFLLNSRVTLTQEQVSAGNTQIAIGEKTLTPIPPTLTAVAQTVVAGSSMIESLSLSREANSILQTEGGNVETAALLSIRVLRKMYFSPADAALVGAVNRLSVVPLEFPTQGYMSQVAFSPDGKSILIGNSGNSGNIGADSIELRDALTGNLIWTNSSIYSRINSVAFSPDGKLVLIAASNSMVTILNAESGDKTLELTGQGQIIQKAVFSFDSKSIFALDSSSETTVKKWDVKTGELQYSVPVFSGAPILIFFSNGQVLYAGNKFYNISDGTINQSLKLNSGLMALSPDGTTFLDGNSSTPTIRSLSDSRIALPLNGHSDSILSASFSENGKLLVTGSSDKTARVWDVSSGKQLMLLSGNTQSVESVAFSPDGTKIITGSNSARLWQINVVDQQIIFSAPAPITDSALSPDGKTILLGDEGGNTGLWDVNTGNQLLSFPKNYHDVKSVAYSPDGKLAAITIKDFGTSNSVDVKLIDTTTGIIKKTFTVFTHSPFIENLAFSSDGKMLLTVDDNGISRLLDISSGQIMRMFISKNSTTVLSPDGTLIGVDGGTGWINISTGEENYFIGNYYDGEIIFSPDGKMLAITNADNSISVLDFSTQNVINRFSGHNDLVNSIAISPDNKYLLSGSTDKTARLWNISTGQLIRVFEGHTSAVTGVFFTPDGKKIITTSRDKTVRTWIASIDEFIDYACTLVGNDLSNQVRIHYGISEQDPICPQFGLKAYSMLPTSMPMQLATPVPIWTPIATPTPELFSYLDY